MPVHHRCICAVIAAAIVLVAALPAPAVDFMFRARINGDLIEGKPLAWDATNMALLERDGQLRFFDPREAKDGKKTGMRFHGYSMAEMKAELYREFGKDYDVTTTNHYIVVHPRGQKDQWAQRFEDMYRSFNRYFRVRGFTLDEPNYPLVAVVYRNETQYFDAAKASGKPKEPGTLGHYDPTSNRVFLFDVTADNNGVEWSHNADTIIHEATHQSAYNAGIHSRFSPTPRWVVEGLATMFEARGVWDSQHHSSDADRINYDQLRKFKESRSKWQDGDLASFIASDKKFRTNPLDAYAQAWALSYYLCETQPRQYAKYLAKTAERPLFTKYPDEERVADFQEFFGENLRIFESKFLRWMEGLD